MDLSIADSIPHSVVFQNMRRRPRDLQLGFLLRLTANEYAGQDAYTRTAVAGCPTLTTVFRWNAKRKSSGETNVHIEHDGEKDVQYSFTMFSA
jgi:hypothetical protein